MKQTINDLFSITPLTARVLVALFDNPLIGGSKVSKISKVAQSSIYIHLTRLCEMDYVRKKGLKYELTNLGYSVIVAIEAFKENRNERSKTKQQKVSNIDSVIVNSNC